MDSLTHIVLGACIGEAVLSKKLGKKALFIGAVAQSFPDIDILGTLWNTRTEDLWFHRGITHSFIFALAAAIVLAFLTQKIYKRQQLPFQKIFLFFCLQLCLHDILDTCNSYGTGLLEPFSDHRFSFNLLFVLDPLFTLPMLIVFVMLLIFKFSHPHRKKWILAALLLPCFYLGYAISNKTSVDKQIAAHLPEKTLSNKNFISTPTAFNTWLWYIIVPSDSGFHIGYRSVFDSKKYSTPYEYYPQNEYLLTGLQNTGDVQELKKFSGKYYTVENVHDTLILNVLRFGRVAGWDNLPTVFTFQFYLNEGFNNDLLVQRGRAKEINRQAFIQMYDRIKGIKD